MGLVIASGLPVGTLFTLFVCRVHLVIVPHHPTKEAPTLEGPFVAY
jgi:hypothetical protein